MKIWARLYAPGVLGLLSLVLVSTIAVRQAAWVGTGFEETLEAELTLRQQIREIATAHTSDGASPDATGSGMASPVARGQAAAVTALLDGARTDRRDAVLTIAVTASLAVLALAAVGIWVSWISARPDQARADDRLADLERRLAEARAMVREQTAALGRARTSGRAKSAFLADMSHELKTPMTGVIDAVGLLLRTPLDTRQRRYAEITRDSAQALLCMVDDILDFSRLEAGKLALAIADVNVADLARDVVTLLEPRARDRGLELTLTVDGQMPAWLRVDGGRLRQILFNLIGNAIKFTDAGHVRVKLGARRSRGRTFRVRCTVKDTGVGIAREAQARLFERFAQADATPQPQRGGTGLGLAISKQLVDLMGGRIGVTSTPGQGSTFWFELVCPPGHPVRAAGADAPANDDGTRADDGRPLRILLAEDHPVNRFLFREMIESLGHKIDVAEDGEAAVRAAGAGDYDLVLMDVRMPELDGIAATRRIRDLAGARSRVPVIALTADLAGEDRAVCQAAGMTDYLSKPVKRHELAAAIDRSVGRLPVGGPARSWKQMPAVWSRRPARKRRSRH